LQLLLLISKVLCDEIVLGFDQIPLSLVQLLVTCIPSSIISTQSLDTFSHVVLCESRDISIVSFKKAGNSVLKSTGVFVMKRDKISIKHREIK